MTQIQVVFPVKGAPLVLHGREALLENEFVFWHVESRNPKVKQVQLRFGDLANKFFPSASGTAPEHEIVRPISTRSDVMIWGQAPRLGANRKKNSTKGRTEIATKRRRSKYTVLGLDAQGKVLVQLDPEIITTRP